MQTGKVIQVIGAAIDIEFAQDHLPAIQNAIEIEMEGNKKIVAEVAQQMGDGIVRCVSLESTDGLQRGAKAVDTGAPSLPI
jgi:F-type H+-transporting ATPase subunit beta